MIYLALPKPLQLLLSDLAQSHTFEVTLEHVLACLPCFGIQPQSLRQIRKTLLQLGRAASSSQDAVTDLLDALRETPSGGKDALGGFARLFEAALLEGEIARDQTLAFSGLEAPIRLKLAPLELELLRLSYLEELSEVLAVDVAVPMSLSAVIATKRLFHVSKSDVCDFLVARQRTRLLLLWEFAENPILTPALMSCPKEALMDACLWYLTCLVRKEVTPNPLEKRLCDTLLARAGLAPLEVFEQAGLF